jgi:hypothetical protein
MFRLDEGMKVGKELVTELLAPARSVLEVLDVISTLHPVVSVSVICQSWFWDMQFMSRQGIVGVFTVKPCT